MSNRQKFTRHLHIQKNIGHINSRWFAKSLKAFASDERGVFAVIFGILAIVLVALGGAAVDFVSIQNARALTQSTLDSTALTLQPKIYTKTESELQILAEALLLTGLSTINVGAELESVSKDTSEGTLFLEARISVPLPFLSLVGVSDINARVSAVATRKQLFLEVGMVLDNSGSMSAFSRMDNLKTAASNATEIIFNGASTSTTTKIGIIPFTSFVNVGTANSGASWIDVTGNSSIANDNFDNDDDDSTPFNGPVNRLALYDQLNNVQWGGCVDARPHTETSGPTAHLDTDDTLPSLADPDTLFVPSFSPDTPNSWAGWQSDYISDTASAACSFLSGGASDRERQERLCKYNGSIDTTAWGPNFDCPSAALLPLSDTKQDVLDAIDIMAASGATNIHMGAIWGLRVVSPTLPFAEGRPYDPDTMKVLIIMTDGENTMYSTNNMNGAHYYSPYGFPVNQRIGAWGWDNTQLRTEMNVRTVEACNNAKNANIVVYTVGLNPPNAATQTMLQECATSLAHAFFPGAPDELDSVFAQIANQLSALRLSR
ncbi:MAG: hypothetical protein L3J13_02390 [Devosiaceae bacterium]|nr:hypothetical protein [Devosiaceae bacterium]